MKNKKEGMAMIDALVSMVIFCVLSLAIFSIINTEHRYLKSIEKNTEKAVLIEAIRNEIKYNLKVQSGTNRFYINNDKLSIDSIKNEGINSVISQKHDGNLPFIEIDIDEGMFYKVKYSLKSGKDEILGEVYKEK